MIADIVLKNGVVYTADAGDAVHEATAILGDRILFVGSNDAVQRYIGPATKLIDLGGKLVIPGMIDSHIHPPGLSLLELYEVKLFDSSTFEGYLDAVREFLLQNPDTKLVYGRGWSWGILQGEELNRGPRKEYLDGISTTIPIVLRANDGHTLWVNSKALEVNCVTVETDVPHGGVIERDPISGELWGTLKEAAMGLIALPEYSIEQYVAAMLDFQHKMHRYGITGILTMGSLTFKNIFAACEAMRQEGKLRLRVRGAVSITPNEDVKAQLAAIAELREQYAAPQLKLITAKFFTDGVVEGGTSHLLAPYTSACGKGDSHYGEFLWDEEKLQQAFTLANTDGLQIHVHSTGDASTQKVLDALEYARNAAPTGDYRNTITHLQLVDQQDITRFKDLQVIASVQPYWQFKGPKWWRQVDYQFLGERAERQFPLGTFFANGITVASSSDYPATVEAYPLRAIEIGVTRNLDNGPLFGVEDITDMDDERYLLNKNERATVEQMIKSFTINGAYMLFMENETGSIEPGKLADLVVLDQNILAINPLDIDKTKVVMTIFGGEVVYEKNTLE
jgi:predicted amidohydrolase YtcJ